MTAFFRKYQNVILIIVVLSFLSGVGYVGYGAYSSGAANRGTAAMVGSEKISAAAYNRLVNRQETDMRRKGDVTDADIELIKQRAMQGLLYESALVQGAEKYGLYVPDFELAYAIRTSPLFNQNGMFDKRVYVWTVRNQFNMNPGDFEAEQRRAMLMQRAENLFGSAYRLTPEEIKYNFKTQYGSLKNFDAKKADFIPTVQETKNNAATDEYLAYFNANNPVKVTLADTARANGQL